MQELNIHQTNIISNLAFKQSARFAELNTDKLPNDQFNYHLKTLVSQGYLDKSIENEYSLTQKGKQYASSLDIFVNKPEIQSRIHVLPACVKEIDGIKHYLVHRRKKHPYFGWMGFPTGKIKFGQDFESEVIRELEEETGLVGTNPILKVVHHVLVKTPESEKIVDDRIFFYFLITDLNEENFQSSTIEGDNFWMTKAQLLESNMVFSNTLAMLENIEKAEITYKQEYQVFEKI